MGTFVSPGTAPRPIGLDPTGFRPFHTLSRSYAAGNLANRIEATRQSFRRMQSWYMCVQTIVTETYYHGSPTMKQLRLCPQTIL